jgi:SAM-dependent methyltransferase
MPTPGDLRVPGRYLSPVSFSASAEAYDLFMGRYSSQLAAQMCELARLESGNRTLDVGCGPGALTDELVARLGVNAVSAIDPTDQFIAAVRERNPGVDAQVASAEELPFGHGTFDAALAQLVVHFMADPVRGLSEMARVTRDDGVVVACVWDHAGEQTPLAPFWQVARELDPDAEDESDRAGGRKGHLGELLSQAGLHDVEETSLPVRVVHATFEDWWQPFTLGVGPAGSYYQQAESELQRQIEDSCRRRLGAPITLEARAWAARGVA